MEKTEQHYKDQIAEEILRIAGMEQNKEAAKKFWQALEKIKPKTCKVKYGWHSGDNIGFTLAFDKGGDKNPYEAFIEALPCSAEIYGFIYGLCPKIFHYNPQYTLTDETYTYLNFKLKRNG